MLKKFIAQYRYTVGLIILALGVLVVLWIVQPSPAQKTQIHASPTVQSKIIRLGTFTPELTAFGTVSSPNVTTLKASLADEVTAITVKTGSIVRKGQILISLDDRKIRLQLKQQQAKWRELQAQLAIEKQQGVTDQKNLKQQQHLLVLEKKALAREATLAKKSLASKSRLDQARQALVQQELVMTTQRNRVSNHTHRITQLTAQCESAQALVEQLKIDVDKATITAPFDGVILNVDTALGANVVQGEVLLRLYDQQTLEIRADIPLRYQTTLQQALQTEQPIQARFAKIPSAPRFTLTRLAGEITHNKHSIAAFFAIPPKSHSLLLGQTIELIIGLLPITHTTIVPITALYHNNTIYRIENHQLMAISVRPLGKKITILDKHQHSLPQQHIIIESPALHTGDEVLTSYLPTARNGLVVQTTENSPK